MFLKNVVFVKMLIKYNSGSFINNINFKNFKNISSKSSQLVRTNKFYLQELSTNYFASENCIFWNPGKKTSFNLVVYLF